MKKVISIVFCALLIVCLFAACGKKDGSSDSASSASGVDANVEFSTDDVTFAEESGESRYNVVRPSNGSDVIANAASSVFRQIKSVCGVNLKNVSDESDGSDLYEILIGETNRPETAVAKEYLVSNVGTRVDDYIICTIGKKIVILGVNDKATAKAAEYFNQTYVVSSGVAGGILYTNATVGDFTDLIVAGNNISKYKIIRPHYNSSYLTQVELEALESYILTASGYEVLIYEDMYEAVGEYEIVVGNTNREGAPIVEDYDSYVIKTVGNKVFINGGSNYATALAVSEFSKMLKKLEMQKFEK